jgi:hypothetical protein
LRQLRISQSNWLAASLFPYKIYTLFVGVILSCWHANLPPKQTNFDRFSRTPHHSFDEVRFHAATDFAYVAHFARLGYFFCAIVLIIGEIIQFNKVSRKSGALSVVFGLVALIVGLFLTSYAQPPSSAIKVL